MFAAGYFPLKKSNKFFKVFRGFCHKKKFPENRNFYIENQILNKNYLEDFLAVVLLAVLQEELVDFLAQAVFFAEEDLQEDLLQFPLETCSTAIAQKYSS